MLCQFHKMDPGYTPIPQMHCFTSSPSSLMHSSHCGMLLINPRQHYQPWPPMLLGLLADSLREVPPLPQLSDSLHSVVFHSCPALNRSICLRGAYWACMPCDSSSFLKLLPTVSARQCIYRRYPWLYVVVLWQISPLTASVQQLVQFLEFLFSSYKLPVAPSVIKGYRSAANMVF